jgi:predicted flavoprotein YhiN
MPQFDVLIIGAGAAGLMAAAAAGQAGQSCLLLEKNRKLGVKILMSGGTRCNITHHCSVRDIVAAYGRQGKFLHSALASLPPEEVIQKIESQGVATKIESTGKIFPVSNKAIDVRDALVDLAVEAGAKIANESPVRTVTAIENDSAGPPMFRVETDRDSFVAKRIIITTGGLSYPGCGTTGDGYGWARSFGHSIVTTVPALVPILSRCQWANELKGITIPEVGVKVWQSEELSKALVADSVDAIGSPDSQKTQKNGKAKKAKVLDERLGSFLFTHWGFSGPSVLDVSRFVAMHPKKNQLNLICDFLPGIKTEALTETLNQKRQAAVKQSVGGLLADYFPRRFGEALIEAGDVRLHQKNAELSKGQMRKIVQQVKECRFSVNGTLGFEKAEVTAGGVSLKEVSSKTMESKFQPGLFFAGEVLDLDGPIGGFNFQAAFSTGWLAGLDCD